MTLKMRETKSVNDFFKGAGTRIYGLTRATTALDRLRGHSNFFETAGLLFDCAITISTIADWVFHTEIENNTKWKEYHLRDGDKKFTNWVRAKSLEIAMLTDISNTAKHHTRTNPNADINEIDTQVEFEESTGEQDEVGVIITTADGQELPGNLVVKEITVVLKNRHFERPAHEVIEAAIKWWTDFSADLGPA